VTGTKTIRVEIFFTIQIEYTLRDIIKDDLDWLSEESVRVDVKRIVEEYTNKLGYLTGPIVDHVNMQWYDKMLKYSTNLDQGTLEVRKDIVYEGDDVK